MLDKGEIIMDKIDPRWAWEPYAGRDWDLKKAGHLLRRATFGPTWTELQTAFEDGPEKTVDRLVKGGSEEQFDAELAPLTASIRRTNDGNALRGWWVYRMLYSPHPLREKITLFWHNHFATSQAKVNRTDFMLRQYQLLRTHALGSFRKMLLAMSTDPAMLIWLDGRDSRKGNPNENYARELMELFSLGVGNYTEQDIREAARAFTGWEIQAGEAVFNASQHDVGNKTVLGKSGKFKPDDIVGICLDQPACPYFLTRKLFRFLVSETIEPTPELLEPLATQLRRSDYDFGDTVKTVLRSNLFFSPEVYRTRIKSPVDFTLGIVRALEGKIGTLALAAALEELGQNVFFPPSVKGWDGGRTWLNGQTLLSRQNLALALTSTEDARFGRRTDPAVVARKHGRQRPVECVGFFLDLFLQSEVPVASRERLLDYAKKSEQQTYPVFWSKDDAEDQRVRSLCHLVLTMPEFQLD